MSFIFGTRNIDSSNKRNRKVKNGYLSLKKKKKTDSMLNGVYTLFFFTHR